MRVNSLLLERYCVPLDVCILKEHPAPASMKNNHFHCMVSNQEERATLKSASDWHPRDQNYLKYIPGVDQMAQRLMALAALAEELSSDPNTHIAAKDCL